MAKHDSANSMRPDPPPTVYSVPEPHPLASCIPTAKTNAAMISDGPSGAMAPPYFGESAATGTTTQAQIAMTIRPPKRPPASPRVRNRRQEAV